MKKLTTTLCLTVALLFGCAGVCKSENFDKGMIAYKSADYRTALRIWKNLAKQGHAKAQVSRSLTTLPISIYQRMGVFLWVG